VVLELVETTMMKASVQCPLAIIVVISQEKTSRDLFPAFATIIVGLITVSYRLFLFGIAFPQFSHRKGFPPAWVLA
jgi:hypothetical protein